MDFERLGHYVAEAVRGELRDQRDLWRRIPLLALMADGKTGFSERYSTAYTYGHWTFPPLAFGKRPAAVDLDSAELVNAYYWEEPAEDSGIIELLGYPELINVKRIISDLEESAGSSISPWMESQVSKRWHQEMKEKLGLEELYSKKPLRVARVG